MWFSPTQRKLAISEAEKKDYEKVELRLDKDRTDLKKILNKVGKHGRWYTVLYCTSFYLSLSPLVVIRLVVSNVVL